MEDYCSRLGPTVIAGDFNCPNIDWLNMLPPADVANQKLFDFVAGSGFSQVVTELTRSNNVLDLVMINYPFLLVKTEVTEPFSTSDHNVVKTAFIYERNVAVSLSSCDAVVKTYNWNLGDYVSMSNYLLAYNWDYLFSTHLTAHSRPMWCAFRNVLDTAIDMFVPVKYVSNRTTNKRKYPRTIRAMAQRKQCLWRLHRRCPDDQQLHDRYRQSAKEYKSAVHDYELSKEQQILDRAYWKYWSVFINILTVNLAENMTSVF